MEDPIIPAAPAPLPRPVVEAYLESLSKTSRVTMRSKLAMAAQLLGGTGGESSVDWAALLPSEVELLRSALTERYRESTTATTMSAVRGVFKVCRAAALVSAERLEGLLRAARTSSAEADPRRCLSAAELAGLYAAAERDPVVTRGARDGCLLALLAGAGLRRATAVGLPPDAYLAEPRLLVVPADGERPGREIPLSAVAAARVERWLALRASGESPLLQPVLKNGRAAARRVRPEAVREILTRVALTAGVVPPTAEDLRRTWAHDLLAAGVGLPALVRLAGHRRSLTTLRLALLTIPLSSTKTSGAIPGCGPGGSGL